MGPHKFRVAMLLDTVGTSGTVPEFHFEVGKEYEVLKVDAHALTVIMHEKKGREIKERLDITGVEEAK